MSSDDEEEHVNNKKVPNSNKLLQKMNDYGFNSFGIKQFIKSDLISKIGNDNEKWYIYILKILLISNSDEIFNYMKKNGIDKIIAFMYNYFIYYRKRINNYNQITYNVDNKNIYYNDLIEYLSYNHDIEIEYINENNIIKPWVKFVNITIDYNDIKINITNDNFSDLRYINNLVDNKYNNSVIICKCTSKTLTNDLILSEFKNFLSKTINKTCIIYLSNTFNDVIKNKIINSYVNIKLKIENLVYVAGFPTNRSDFIKSNKFGVYNLDSEKKHNVDEYISIDLSNKFLIDKIDDIEIYYQKISDKMSKLYCHCSDKTKDKEEIYKIVIEHIDDFLTENESEEDKNYKFKKHSIYGYNYESNNVVSINKFGSETIFISEKEANIIKNINKRYKSENVFANKFNFGKKIGVLLYGPPGTGKTTIIKYIANSIDKSILMIDMAKIKSDDQFETIFKMAEKYSLIIVVEEFDKQLINTYNKITESQQEIIAQKLLDKINDKNDSEIDDDDDKPNNKSKKNKKNDNKKNNIDEKREGLNIDWLMNKMDGLTSEEDQVIILTSNHPEIIMKYNQALMRPGRIDYCIKMDNCNRSQLKQILEHILEKPFLIEDFETFVEYKYSVVFIIQFLVYYADNLEENDLENFDVIKMIDSIESYIKFTSYNLI